MSSATIGIHGAQSNNLGLRAPLRHKQKRSQVARACNACRIHRVKCDNNFPCSNCSARNRVCSNNESTKASTLSQAHDEIERLRNRVGELETELQRERENHQQLTPADSYLSNISILGDVERHDDKEPARIHWDGIRLRPSRSPNGAWFGPSSLYYYIYRLNSYLSSASHNVNPTQNMFPQSVGSDKLFERSPAKTDKLANRIAASANEAAQEAVYLSAVQEEYFINLFWETYHTSFVPIIDEADFKKHYQSLWIENSSSRKPSALADIIIAMCMQVGVSALPTEQQGSIAEKNDATIAGRWHFRRAQMLLSLESESPTISTLQCHLLCIAYLCGGSFHNMVDIANVLSVRTAQILGLHLESSVSISEQERQMRRRLWWAVYLVDSKVGMKLGRPFLLSDDYVMPDLPKDDFTTAVESGSTFAPIGANVTWLSFNLQQTKLYSKVRAAHISFYTNRGALSGEQALWDNPQALEECAKVLLRHTKDLDSWTAEVPMALKINRQDSGSALSTDGTSLVIEQFAPLWLQRQRVLLELTYHHLCVNLYRPFISLAKTPALGTLAEQTAIRCAAHAIALSKITHQVLSTTVILNGWHEAFQWQWSASMTLIGYLAMYSWGPLAEAVREALELALKVFDIFGVSFEVAASAASIARELLAKVDQLLAQTENNVSLFNDVKAATNTVVARDGHPDTPSSMLWDDGSFDFSNPTINYEDTGSNLFNMVLDVDFWADIDMLWPSSAPPPQN